MVLLVPTDEELPVAALPGPSPAGGPDRPGHEKVKDGELVDEQTRQYAARALARFADWIGQGA